MNIHANASSLGRLAALLAAGGKLDGIRLFSKQTMARALFEPKFAYDPTLDCTYGLTKGGFTYFDMERSRLPVASSETLSFLDGSYGCYGFGGSLFVFNPHTNFALAHAGNKLSTRCLGSASLDAVFAGILECFAELARIEHIEKEAAASPRSDSKTKTSKSSSTKEKPRPGSRKEDELPPTATATAATATAATTAVGAGTGAGASDVFGYGYSPFSLGGWYKEVSEEDLEEYSEGDSDDDGDEEDDEGEESDSDSSDEDSDED